MTYTSSRNDGKLRCSFTTNNYEREDIKLNYSLYIKINVNINYLIIYWFLFLLCLWRGKTGMLIYFWLQHLWQIHWHFIRTLHLHNITSYSVHATARFHNEHQQYSIKRRTTAHNSQVALFFAYFFYQKEIFKLVSASTRFNSYLHFHKPKWPSDMARWWISEFSLEKHIAQFSKICSLNSVNSFVFYLLIWACDSTK